MFVTALLILDNNIKELKCPSIDKQLNEQWYIHAVGSITERIA